MHCRTSMNHVHRRYWKLEYLSWHGITLNKSEHVGPTPDFQTLRIHVMVQQGANNMQNWGGVSCFPPSIFVFGGPGERFSTHMDLYVFWFVHLFLHYKVNCLLTLPIYPVSIHYFVYLSFVSEANHHYLLCVRTCDLSISSMHYIQYSFFIISIT